MSKKDFKESNQTKNIMKMFGEEEAKEPSRTETQTETKTETKAEKKKPIKEKQKAAEPGAIIPKGYTLKEEAKSQRLQLLLKPSTFQDLKELSEKTGESVNAICNKFLEKCLRES